MIYDNKQFLTTEKALDRLHKSAALNGRTLCGVLLSGDSRARKSMHRKLFSFCFLSVNVIVFSSGGSLLFVQALEIGSGAWKASALFLHIFTGRCLLACERRMGGTDLDDTCALLVYEPYRSTACSQSHLHKQQHQPNPVQLHSANNPWAVYRHLNIWFCVWLQ